MLQFEGQKVVITGASRGIGQAIALAFLEHGATVIGIYRSNQDAAERFLSIHNKYQNQIFLFQCDISNAENVGHFFTEIEQRFDDIQILINNAGIRRDAVLAMMPITDWQEVIDTNLTGSFLMAKHAVLLMMKRKFGRIITITSPAAYLGFAGQSNYAASKAGQIGMMKTLARETAKKGITVNCISPGFIETDFLDGLTTEQIATYKKMIPMRRFGKAEEIADAAFFLSSRKASYITGAVLEVNGGL
jgi:3-oxoacyl-[acyl-carrier protein] reductase